MGTCNVLTYIKTNSTVVKFFVGFEEIALYISHAIYFQSLITILITVFLNLTDYKTTYIIIV